MKDVDSSQRSAFGIKKKEKRADVECHASRGILLMTFFSIFDNDKKKSLDSNEILVVKVVDNPQRSAFTTKKKKRKKTRFRMLYE